MKRYIALALTLILAFTALGFKECSSSQKKTVREQLVISSDRLANSVKLAQGVVSDLYFHQKISTEVARDLTEKLSQVNTLGRRANSKIEEFLAKNPDPNTLPDAFKLDLNGILNEISALLDTIGGGGASQWVDAVRDIISIVNEFKGLLRG